METITLPVTRHTKGDSVKPARLDDKIPMVYYGKGVENQQFIVDYQSFRRAYIKGGKSTIMTLVTEDKKQYPVLVQDIQFNPVTDQMIHIDLTAVDMNKTIYTYIPLVFTGTSPAVKDHGGILVYNKNEIEIECLPKDLVHEIEVDVSGLADLHSSLRVGEIKMPHGIKVLDALDINVVTVTVPRSVTEEETAAPVVAPGAIPTTAQKVPEAGAAAPAAGDKKAEKKPAEKAPAKK